MLKHIREASYPLVSLPRYAKRIIVLSVDISLCVLTVWLAFYLRLGDFVTLSGPALWAVAIAVAIALPIFVVSGLYRAIFRYSGIPAIFAVAPLRCTDCCLPASSRHWRNRCSANIGSNSAAIAVLAIGDPAP